jgi:hypothetical protein
VTNQQLYLATGIPSVLVLLNMLQVQFFRSEVATELRAIRSDMTMLTKMYGEHGERIARLEATK